MDGKLYINGEAEENSDVIGETLITDQNIQYPLLIGENEYFALGDNREAAVDSRNYIIGIINEDDIVGKVVFCVKKLN
jgi:signal peptidase I